MKCDECNETKENQKYEDTCDICVMRMMKELWDQKVKPLIKGTIQAFKDRDN